MHRFARLHISSAIAAGLALTLGGQAYAQQKAQCPVDHDKLSQVLKQSVKASGGADEGGLPVNEWAAVVTRDGVVCAVAFSGTKPTDQWLGSRAIAVEKANTVNAFGLDAFAISTANLWAPSQPGGSLYGAANSNPPVAQDLYAGPPDKWGSDADPLIGKVVGGVIAFGGGLPLYDQNKHIVGGLGASGNTSCADHNIAWRMRQALKLDNVPNGPSPDHNDEIVYDIAQDGKSQSGWGHPTCGFNAPQIAEQLHAGIVKTQAAQTSGAGTPEKPAQPQQAPHPQGQH
jgi:uncharacterized protein GlcG (DUF336 family)